MVGPSLLVIEPMLPEDLNEVLRLDHRCFHSPWTRTAFAAELANRAAYYLKASIEHQIVGFGGEWILLGEAHITTLAVAPEWRRQKIGEQLLIALLEEAIRRKAFLATLEVRESNLIAQNLYRKYGFQPRTIRRNYYTDNGENAIVMWAEAIDTPAYLAMLQANKGNQPPISGHRGKIERLERQ